VPEATEFKLPDVGEGLTEARIERFLVTVGDHVDVLDPVIEVETEKSIVELTSPFSGTVTSLHGTVGEYVDVGEVLMTFALDE
jgi:pyruvate dehydrogenase E2 component (dihydrolipoamide acetyltransferase)